MSRSIANSPREEEVIRSEVHADQSGILELAYAEVGWRIVGEQWLSIDKKLIARAEWKVKVKTCVLVRPENRGVTVATVF